MSRSHPNEASCLTSLAPFGAHHASAVCDPNVLARFGYAHCGMLQHTRSRFLIIGHSHAGTIRTGWQSLRHRERRFEATVLNLRQDEYRLDEKFDTGELDSVDLEAVRRRILELAPSTAVTVLALRGGTHTGEGFEGKFRDTPERGLAMLEDKERPAFEAWYRFLAPLCAGRVVVVPPPPPIGSSEFILSRLGPLRDVERSRANLDDIPYRLSLWQRACDVEAAIARRHGVEVLTLPPSVFAPDGTLAHDCRGNDGSHANGTFGERVLSELVAQAVERADAAPPRHPYTNLPDHRFWKQAVSEVARDAIDPVIEPPFVIARTDRVVTAGSCFAQHISKYLRSSACAFVQAEPRSESAGADEPDFSARYGNIYTARQLRQLFERAMWFYKPQVDCWRRPDGRFCDPFRPRIEPNGHASEHEVRDSRTAHLVAVQKMFRELDVLVFTMGLTEAWTSRLDGAVYPLAPGVAGGVYDPQHHAFANFSVREMVDDLTRFFHGLKLVNPRARMIITVSPQPIVATLERQHVLTASTYTKAALRVAADEFSRAFDDVYYFPSYEMITGSHAAGAYFAEDRRSVTRPGVEHVMRTFMSRLVDIAGESVQSAPSEGDTLMEAACDEEAIAR